MEKPGTYVYCILSWILRDTETELFKPHKTELSRANWDEWEPLPYLHIAINDVDIQDCMSGP